MSRAWRGAWAVLYTTAGPAPRSCADVPMLPPSRVRRHRLGGRLHPLREGFRWFCVTSRSPHDPTRDDVRRRSVRGVGAARRRTATPRDRVKSVLVIREAIPFTPEIW